MAIVHIYRKTVRFVALMLIGLLLLPLIPPEAVQAATTPDPPQLKEISYTAQAPGTPVTDITITATYGLSDATRVRLRGPSGFSQIVNIATVAEDQLILEPVTFPETLREASLLTVIIERKSTTLTFTNAIQYHGLGISSSVTIDIPSGKAGSPETRNIYSVGFYTEYENLDTDPLTGRRILFEPLYGAAILDNYSVLPGGFDPAAPDAPYDFPSGFTAKRGKSALAGFEATSFIIPPTGVPGSQYRPRLERINTARLSTVRNVIRESIADPIFRFTGNELPLPEIISIENDPLYSQLQIPDQVALQSMIPGQVFNSQTVQVRVKWKHGTDKSKFQKIGNKLVIANKNLEIDMETPAPPDDNGFVLSYANIPRDLYKTTTTGYVYVLRSHDFGATPLRYVRFWADPYHRNAGSKLTVNQPTDAAGRILIQYNTKGDPTIEIASDAPGAFDLPAPNQGDKANIEIVFGDHPLAAPPENVVQLSTAEGSELYSDKFLFKVPPNMIVPISNTSTNEYFEVPVWIRSYYGYSRLDSKVFFYVLQNQPVIHEVKITSINNVKVTYEKDAKPEDYPKRPTGMERTIPRNATIANLEIKGFNFIQGLTTVKIGELVVPPELIRVNTPAGGMTITLTGTQLAQLPGDVPIIITNGMGQSANSTTDPVRYKIGDNTYSATYSWGATVVGGFRYLSVPDFPTLPHTGDQKLWPTWLIDPNKDNRYRLKLNDVVKVPTQAIDIMGGQIVKLKNGRDFFRVSQGIDQVTGMEKWLLPKIELRYISNVKVSTVAVPPGQIEVPLENGGTELSFRVPCNPEKPEYLQEALGIPNSDFALGVPIYIDVIITNPDGQKVIIPKAIEVIKRGNPSTVPVITDLTPDIVPNIEGVETQGRTVVINGSNFRGSSTDKPRVFMHFTEVPAANITYIDDKHISISTVPLTFFDGMQDRRKIIITVINPDDGTASYAYYDQTTGAIVEDKPNVITVIRPQADAPYITAVTPNYSPINLGPLAERNGPYIFIRGNNFKPTGSTRGIKQIYMDEIPVFVNDPSSEHYLQPGQYTYNNDLIAIPMPDIPTVRKNMTIIIQFYDDTAAWSGFNTYQAKPLKVDSVSPNKSPEAASGLPMADITITGSGFGTNAQVYIGGQLATLNAPSTDTTILAKVPPLPAGTYKITVANPDSYGIGSPAEDFTYLGATDSAPPKITDLWVDGVLNGSLLSSGGQQVLLKGDFFYPPDADPTDAKNQPLIFLNKKLVPASSIPTVPTMTEIEFTAVAINVDFFAAGEKSKMAEIMIMRADGATVIKQVLITRSEPSIDPPTPCGADINDLPRPSIYISGYNLDRNIVVRFGNDQPGQEAVGTGDFDVSGSQVERVIYSAKDHRSVFRVTVPNLESLYRDQSDDPRNWIRVRVFNPDGQVAESPNFLFRLYDNEITPVITAIEPSEPFSASGGAVASIKMRGMVINWQDKNQWPIFSFGGIRVAPNYASAAINYPPDPNTDMTKEPVRLIKPAMSESEEWTWEVIVPAYPWPTEGQKATEDYLEAEVRVINRYNCTETSGADVGYITYYRPQGDISLVKVSPDIAPLEGGISAVITAQITPASPGKNGSKGFLVMDGQLPKVYFGTVPGTVNDVNADGTRMTVIVPAHDQGKVDITVVNPNRTQGVLRQAFTYAAIPVIESLRPNSGPSAGGINVMIRGRGFVAGAKVKIGQVEAEVLSTKTEEIQIILPAYANFPTDASKVVVDVTVINADGGEYTLANGFTYYKDEGQPTERPLIVAKALSRDTIRVTWPIVPLAKSYELEVSEGGRGNYRLSDVVKNATARDGVVSVLVTGLNGNTVYWFRVRAVSSIGMGPYSDEVSALTKNNTDSWGGFTQPDVEAMTTATGPKLLLRKGTPEKYYDLRTGLMGAGKVKQVTFSPETQVFTTPVMFDSGDWKVLIPPLTLKYNAGSLTDSYATIQVGPAPSRSAEQARLANRTQQPLAPIYEFKAVFEKDNQSFTPLQYGQPFTLTLNYQQPKNNQRVSLFYYDGTLRNWIKQSSYVDAVAVSAAIYRAGFYTVYPE
ncbi:IPT/TIG domain-containing protein [Heliophilum fasciatum]|uniref:IPT/TIG domain-containing protein n=1 Tax=Heliophilum fasciatum TaxID=35700 RepID=A0A4V2SX80_9FIRM|nr:IPT/TIG domain-containing protein [Heliophilum fasciatum]MCW2277463.1 hypothetical protein [Heliophilum fasciatum]TCP65246.1 IPT/TIG domain-containing protein [Heliophilum fasciatum]